MISVPSGHLLVTVQSELAAPFLASASPSAASSSAAAKQRLVGIEYCGGETDAWQRERVQHGTIVTSAAVEKAAREFFRVIVFDVLVCSGGVSGVPWIMVVLVKCPSKWIYSVSLNMES